MTPSPGALPLNITESDVEWKRIPENGTWFQMPWVSDDAIVRITANYEAALEIADDASAIDYLGIAKRGTFQHAWPMSVHSLTYAVRSRGAK